MKIDVDDVGDNQSIVAPKVYHWVGDYSQMKPKRKSKLTLTNNI